MAKFISLFAGVGGFDLGMEQAGHECVAQVEWDKNAAGVLKHRWPNVPLFCDVSKVSADDLPDADFITYGFPCQDLSVAGKREGLDGKRSGLFYEATRLIRELRSRGCGLRFAVAENVGGLLSADDGVALARCIRELLDSGACETGWRVVDSQYFGVAQRRKRVFIVSDFGGESVDEILAITESLPGYPAPSREAGKGTAGDAGAGFTASSFGGYGDAEATSTLRSQGGDLGGGSEALIAENAEVVGNLAARDYKGVGNQFVSENKLVVQKDGCFSDGTQTSSSLTTRCHNQFMPDKGNFCAVIQAQGADVYSGELTGQTACTVTSATGISNATGPKVIGWNGDTTPKASEDVSVTLRSQQGGEGVGVAHSFYPTAGREFPLEKELSLTVKCGSSLGIPSPPGVLKENLTVRRLTPIECERLQGFPDNWTLEKMELILEGNEWKATSKVVKQADGPRYKAMGNAVTVNVAEWIGKQIGKVLS